MLVFYRKFLFYILINLWKVNFIYLLLFFSICIRLLILIFWRVKIVIKWSYTKRLSCIKYSIFFFVNLLYCLRVCKTLIIIITCTSIRATVHLLDRVINHLTDISILNTYDWQIGLSLWLLLLCDYSLKRFISILIIDGLVHLAH